MTAVELARVAADMPQPVDPYLGPCRAYVSEVGGVWRIVWALDGGRRKVPAGPSFPIDRAGGRDARRLCGFLNGDRPAPRSGVDSDLAGPGGLRSRDEGGRPSEAPDLGYGGGDDSTPSAALTDADLPNRGVGASLIRAAARG